MKWIIILSYVLSTAFTNELEYEPATEAVFETLTNPISSSTTNADNFPSSRILNTDCRDSSEESSESLEALITKVIKTLQSQGLLQLQPQSERNFNWAETGCPCSEGRKPAIASSDGSGNLESFSNLGPLGNLRPSENLGPSNNLESSGNLRPYGSLGPSGNLGPFNDLQFPGNQGLYSNIRKFSNPEPPENFEPSDGLRSPDNSRPFGSLGPSSNLQPYDNLGPSGNFEPSNLGPFGNLGPSDTSGPTDNLGLPSNLRPYGSLRPSDNLGPSGNIEPPENPEPYGSVRPSDNSRPFGLSSNSGQEPWQQFPNRGNGQQNLFESQKEMRMHNTQMFKSKKKIQSGSFNFLNGDNGNEPDDYAFGKPNPKYLTGDYGEGQNEDDDDTNLMGSGGGSNPYGQMPGSQNPMDDSFGLNSYGLQGQPRKAQYNQFYFFQSPKGDNDNYMQSFQRYPGMEQSALYDSLVPEKFLRKFLMSSYYSGRPMMNRRGFRVMFYPARKSYHRYFKYMQPNFNDENDSFLDRNKLVSKMFLGGSGEDNQQQKR